MQMAKIALVAGALLAAATIAQASTATEKSYNVDYVKTYGSITSAGHILTAPAKHHNSSVSLFGGGYCSIPAARQSFQTAGKDPLVVDKIKDGQKVARLGHTETLPDKANMLTAIAGADVQAAHSSC